MAIIQSAAQRHGRICDLLREGKPLSVAELSRILAVSPMTVRRDLDLLQSAGRLRRTRGWAEPVRTEEYEPSYLIRTRENVREKGEIGRAAAGLVEDGEVIFVDVGTTLLDFVRLIGRTKRVTVLTYWLPAVLELAKYENVRTIVLGGILRPSELSLVGGIAGETLSEFNADRAFLSIGGVSVEKGITDYNIDEVEVKRAVIRTARQVVVVADHSKIEHIAPVCVAPLSVVNILVTGAGVAGSHLEAYRAAGVKVIIADREEMDGAIK